MSRIPAGSRMSRIPGLSRIVMVLAASLVALCAAVGVPDASAPSFTTVAQVSDTSPGSPLAASKCKSRSGKKGCRYKRHYSDADLRNLSNGDLETVATLTTVLAVIALAAVI
jgi:hypothetical protein